MPRHPPPPVPQSPPRASAPLTDAERVNDDTGFDSGGVGQLVGGWRWGWRSTASPSPDPGPVAAVTTSTAAAAAASTYSGNGQTVAAVYSAGPEDIEGGKEGNHGGCDDNWSDDPFEDFQSAPPAAPPSTSPKHAEAALSSAHLPSTSAATAAASAVQKNTIFVMPVPKSAPSGAEEPGSSAWNLDFFMPRSSSTKPAGAEASIRGVGGGSMRGVGMGTGKESAGKPLDLVR